MHPIQRLFHYASGYRRDFRLATLYSVLNKFFDILPEVLIGAAVDVVVKGEESFLARNVLGAIGITDTWEQLLALGLFNVLVWAGESLFQYLYEVKWRQLAQKPATRYAPGHLPPCALQSAMRQLPQQRPGRRGNGIY